jgi:hypothetical protein
VIDLELEHLRVYGFAEDLVCIGEDLVYTAGDNLPCTAEGMTGDRKYEEATYWHETL